MTRMARRVTESDFQQTIIDAAHALGWVVAHFRPARVIKNGMETWRTAVAADGAGFPDLILVKPPRLLVVEVKSETGKLSKDQEDWLRLFAKCGIEWHLWYPKDDWQTIEDCLRR